MHETSHMRSFLKIKPLQIDKITPSCTDIYRQIMPLSQIFNVANMSFNAICENKILLKNSKFTVYYNVMHVNVM